jgi:hypothetical protein
LHTVYIQFCYMFACCHFYSRSHFTTYNRPYYLYFTISSPN